MRLPAANVQQVGIARLVLSACGSKWRADAVTYIDNLFLFDFGPGGNFVFRILRNRQDKCCPVARGPDEILVVSALRGVRVVSNAKMIKIMQCKDKGFGPTHRRVIAWAEKYVGLLAPQRCSQKHWIQRMPGSTMDLIAN